MAKDRTRSRAAIAEEAAEWFVELRESVPTRTDKTRFTDWLAESPVHVEEYLAIAKLYGELTHVDPDKLEGPDSFVDDTIVALHRAPPSLDLAAEARGQGTALQVSDSLEQSEYTEYASAEEPAGPEASVGRTAYLSSPVRIPAQKAKRRTHFGLAATVLVAVAASFYLYGGREDAPEVYTTGLGEQRSILLDDGSMVSLNTESGMEVAYSQEERRITLTHGEALFDVEENQDRPFWVETGAALIRVTGTQFNVYAQDGSTAVTVIEGTVEVAPRASPATQVLGTPTDSPSNSTGSAHPQGVAKLTVGDQAVVKSGSLAIVATRIDNLEPVTAWTDRRLVFSETLLSDIVTEFNRYNHQRLILDDATVATLEVSGVFSTHDPESLVLFLERIADVEVEHSADGSEIHVRAAGTTP